MHTRTGRILAVVALCTIVFGPARLSAHDDGRFGDSPLKAWFDKLASGKGLCCSFADGVSVQDVDWDTQGNSYRVRINGAWVVVPDAASVVAARHVSTVLGRRVGPSTGTNVWGAFGLLAEMMEERRSGSVVTLLADSGDRYADTYFCDEWLTSHDLDAPALAEVLVEFERSGRWP